MPHTPAVCMPSAGRKIEDREKVVINGWPKGPFPANRLLVTESDQKMLTYYWVKQGNKMLTDDFEARLDLIRHALFEQRTDAAMIRLVAYFSPEDTEETVEKRLNAFSALVANNISAFIPD